MARYEHLPIYQAAMDLTVSIEHVGSGMSLESFLPHV